MVNEMDDLDKTRKVYIRNFKNGVASVQERIWGVARDVMIKHRLDDKKITKILESAHEMVERQVEGFNTNNLVELVTDPDGGPIKGRIWGEKLTLHALDAVMDLENEVDKGTIWLIGVEIIHRLHPNIVIP